MKLWINDDGVTTKVSHGKPDGKWYIAADLIEAAELVEKTYQLFNRINNSTTVAEVMQHLRAEGLDVSEDMK